MDLDQSSDPAKEGNLPEQTTSASRSLTSNDEKGIQQHHVRAALISAFVPNQNIVNKALDPRRRSKIPENATQSAVSADNHSTTEQPEAQAGSSEPLILGFTATPASAAQGISTMSSPALTNGTLASVSGIVTTDTGERVVPSTTRPDGSVRPTKKVKCGWIPREDGLPYKPPLRTGFDGRLSGPSELEGSKAVLEVSQEAASIPETTDSEQNKSHLFLEALAAEITAQDKSEPSVTEHNHTNRVQGIQSSVGGDQANNNLTSSSASSIEHKINEGIPAQTSDQPATPPSQSEGKQDLCTPLVIGANKVSGCDISPTALPMSPQTSPPRNSELNLFSPVIESRPLSTPSRKKPEAPPVKARQQRPRWYDDTYVVRMKLDAEYEKMKENLRVERFYIKGSRSYSVTLVPPLPAKSSRTAIKKQWFRLIDQQHPDSRLSKHPGFQTVVDDTTAGKLSIPSRAKPTEDDKTSPNSPLEPSDEDPMSSDNRQDTPENGSPYTAGSPDTPTPAERPVAKREHSPSEPPKAKKSKKIKQTLKRADIASRLLEDSRGEVEYIKGEGPRRVNQDLFSSSPSSQSDGEVASESSARYKLKLALTDFIEVKSDGIVKKRERPDLLYLHWIGHRKLLFLSYNNVEVKDTLIKMDQILKVHYGSTPFQIHIEYGFDALAGLANPQHDLYLLLGCDQAQFTTLQGSLSRHVGGMRVNRVLEP